MTKRKENLIAIFVIVFLGVLFHYKYINEFPSHIHAWAESDRYSIAQGFTRNGLNILKPETSIYNHEFPNNWEVEGTESITAVDFPIHDYIPAVLMRLFGKDQPWIFRVYILLYSFIGLFILFKLSYLLTKNFYSSLFILIFASTSPVFVYYQGGFLPTIPSIANAIIGIYYYFLHLQRNDSRKEFGLSILFLTIATLARFTFAIPLIAVLSSEFLRLIQKRTILRPKIPAIILSILAICSYSVYSHYLRSEYGSDFLNYILPAKSTKDAIEILNHVLEQWGFQYFTMYHYWTFLGLLLTGVFYLFKRSKSLNKSNRPNLTPAIFIGIYFIGCIFFAILMLHQYRAHDYYFLDTFYLPIVLCTVLLISLLPKVDVGKYNKSIRITCIALISVPIVRSDFYNQEYRRETGPWDAVMTTVINFEGSDSFLDSLKISHDAKILVIDANAPNLPFVRMKRKGLAIMEPSKEKIEKALFEWDYDYIVVQNDLFISKKFYYPELIQQLNPIENNGKITVCTKNTVPKETDIRSFLKLDNKNPMLRVDLTTNKVDADSKKTTSINTVISDSIENSISMINSNTEFSLNYENKNLNFLNPRPTTVLINGEAYFERIAETYFVVSMKTGTKNIYYKTYNLQEMIEFEKTWKKIDILFTLPNFDEKNVVFQCYVWNKGKSELLTKNLTLMFY